jgi:hypothetical protein
LKDTIHSGIRFTLIGAALAVSLAASAGAEAQQVQHIIATVGTDGGGEWLMTSVTCGSTNKGRAVLALTRNGRVTHRGCAVLLLPDRLYISWDGGYTSVIPRGHFVTAATALAVPAPHAKPAIFTVEELEADMRRRGLYTNEEQDRIVAEQAAATRIPE